MLGVFLVICVPGFLFCYCTQRGVSPDLEAPAQHAAPMAATPDVALKEVSESTKKSSGSAAKKSSKKAAAAAAAAAAAEESSDEYEYEVQIFSNFLFLFAQVATILFYLIIDIFSLYM